MAKVLFQATNSRVFRATLVGYLHEIAQKHQVVLLTEKLDKDTEKVLANKDMFPGLGKIVYFESPFGGNILAKSRKLRAIIKETVYEHKPDIAIAPSDIWPAEMYLMRFAKNAGAITLAIQSGFKMAESRKQYEWSCAMNAHLRMPSFLPFVARKVLAALKKYLGFILYHWVLPVAAGEMPFFGKTSFVFWDESSGKRKADYVAVFSKRDYGLCVEEGVLSEKLFVIGHPLEHASTREFFEKAYFSEHREKEGVNVITLMWPEEKVGLKEGNRSLIGEQEMQESRVRMVALIAKKLADWKVFVKVKPNLSESEIAKVRELFAGEGFVNIAVVAEPADVYIELSDVICGMSLPSTTLFTASKQYPSKPILHLNLSRESLADGYRNFDGIEYVDSESRLLQVLDLIQKGAYQKKESTNSQFDFADAAELIDHLYAKRIS